MGGLTYHIQIFLEIAHNEAQEKNLDVFIFPLLKMKDIAIVLIVIIAVLIIHANNKPSLNVDKHAL